MLIENLIIKFILGMLKHTLVQPLYHQGNMFNYEIKATGGHKLSHRYIYLHTQSQISYL